MTFPTGQYDQYATLVENHFFDPALMALDEYGLPFEITQKLAHLLVPDGDLDTALERLKTLDVNQLDLSAFEMKLLSDTIDGL